MKQKLPIDQWKRSEQAPGNSQGLVILHILPDRQQMLVKQGEHVCAQYSISTAANGLGEIRNSFKTPRGLHMIRAKIGAGHPINSVFVKRRFTGEIFNQELHQAFPDRDWILTRILWLSGLEPGFNRLGQVDTMRRYIYIHGSPEERPVGVPSSHGCIRMRNQDIIELFDIVEHGTRVYIDG